MIKKLLYINNINNILGITVTITHLDVLALVLVLEAEGLVLDELRNSVKNVAI